MIKYPLEASIYENYRKSKVAQECQLLLENALRLLGDFEEEKPIIINKYELDKNFLDVIYEVKDNQETIFKFYNFNIGYSFDTNRFRQSYHLIMSRKDSNILYKYDFYEFNHKDYYQKLRMIEIQYNLADNRVIKLERKLNRPIKLKVEEGSKKYIIGFYDHSLEYDTSLLEDFENIVEKSKKNRSAKFRRNVKNYQ